MSTGISTWIANFADGGIVPGGFRAFASGGTVTKATLGLVGEGKYNEAVVPLPDGKSIPVMGATGSTENNITVNVTLNSNGDKDQGDTTSDGGESMKNLGHQLSQIVQAELIEQQRHGGLLSRY
jgi:phage-related minor tail protein